MIYEMFCIFLLMFPLTWELLDDRKGDFNKAQDVFWRLLIAVLAASSVWIMQLFHPMHHGFWQSIFLSLAIHFMLFDYGINILLGHTDNWFSYLGKKGVIDNYPLWHNLNPWWKFAIKFSVLIVAICMYV